MIDIARAILNRIEREGIILDDKDDVYKSIDEAIQFGRFEFINLNGKNIGFFTWNIRRDSVTFINNMLIFKEYRGKLNLRAYFNNFFARNGAFLWRNRRSQKEVTVIKGGTPCLQSA